MIIIFSEYSPRVAGLIGKRDPVATLTTLILLSYAKLLSITVTVLLFAVLHHPDGSQEMLWLPDGNVKYFQGKHNSTYHCGPVHCPNWCPLHNSSLPLAVARSCSKVKGFQVDKEH